MNFHKTIGFLATLLLMVGIGVPDSFAQNPTIDVTVSPPRITEGQSRSVMVSVTLSAAPGANTTVEVSVALPSTFPDGAHLTATRPDPANPGSTLDGFATISISGTATSGSTSATVMAAEDDDATTDDDIYHHPRDKSVTITATAAGHDDGTGTLMVREDDTPVGAITLTVDPPSLSVDGTATPTLTAAIPKAPGAGNTVEVTFTTEHSNADDGTSTGGTAPQADITGTDKMATSDLSGMTVTGAGSITVTANAEGYTPGMVTIPIIARNAGDAEGFRVTIISQADGAWVGAGAKKVKVQVRRLNRFAWDWTNFESLVVALRDSLSAVTGAGAQASGGPPNIYTLTVSSFALVDESLVFATGDPGGDRVVAKNTAVTYSKAMDAFTFEFHLLAVTAANVAATLGAATDPPESNRIPMGQAHNVYATATFTSADGDDADSDPDTVLLSSYDTKTDVYTSPSALATVSTADKKVGDGKLIKLDLMAPTNIAIDNLVVTRKNKELAADTELKIDDEIKIAVSIDAQSRFRDGGVQVQIVSVETDGANGTVIGKANKQLHTANFTQVDVINAAGRSLETTWRLTEGLIKLQAKAANLKTRDGKAIKANALFEPDNAGILIRARTKDQANNFSPPGAATLNLIADTRKPVIEVMHPAAGDYFAGAIGDTDTGFDQFLKPLKIRVDEPVDTMAVYVHKDAKFYMWSEEAQNFDRSLSVGDAVNSVGDTIVYDTQGLNLNGKTGDDAKLSSANQGGSKVNLVIEVKDLVGNKTTKTLTGVFHDEKAPVIMDFFPRNELLTSDDNEINNATRHPVITLPETVDSIAVVYDGSGGDDIVTPVSGVTPKGEKEVTITEAFVQDRTYTLTIFARDRAGNAAESDPTLAADMKFNAQFDNPDANEFKVSNMTGNTDPTKASAGVIAGQAFELEIQAIDNNDTPAAGDDLNAVTYKSEVRISAWSDDGGAASSVRFSGKGVSDNGDGSATLDAAEWKLGKRTVHAESEMAIGATKILVQQLNADGEEVFNGSVSGLYVDAADFKGFMLTANEEHADDVEEVWGEFTLMVVPVDEFNNPSLKAFKADPATVADSLKLLDANVDKSANKAAVINYDEVDVTFRSNPALEDLPSLFEWGIPLEGDSFVLVAPENKRSVTIQARVVNESLDDDDTRSQDIKDTARFIIAAPLMPVLTLWGPNGEDLTGESMLTVPAGESLMVTFQVADVGAGDTVTFTKNGEETDVTADENGNATLPVTLSGEGSLMVSAMSGQYPADKELSYTYEEGPDELMRREFTTEPDGAGLPVYLIDLTTDNTVNLNDYTLFRAAWDKTRADNPDDQTVFQSDINDDGTVDLADYTLFVPSWDRTANPGPVPASKPIVLLPGINENAEFSLNLGSERVVAGEMVAVDVSLANVEALVAYGFTLNYDADKFEFISVTPADEDLLKSTGGETPMFHHIVANGQVEVVNGLVNGTAVSGGGDIVRFVFRVLYEFEDNARFEIADGLVFDPTNLSNPAVVAGVLELQSTPREFALHQNFPNPFNPDTTIKYDLAESADITLQIYNVLGQVVRTLVASEAQNAGRYQIRWNGMDDRGVPVSSGVYFYQISAEGKFQQVQKLMLLK